MPFKSLAQERFMFAKHPEIASKWQKEFPSQKKQLPERATPKAKPSSAWEGTPKKDNDKY